MNKKEYILLAILGFGIITISAILSPQSLSEFFIESTIQSLETIITMVWITWWALVLGFGIAGGVEAWISSERIASSLQETTVMSVSKASFFGFVSSSCSYSAIATAKNLFKKGASASTSLGAFMFAATNLVIEIGFVIWVLLGWEFVIANYVGGIILIVLMSLSLRFVVPQYIIEEARESVVSETITDPVCGMDVEPNSTEHSLEHRNESYYFCSEECKNSFNPKAATENKSVKENVTTRAGWTKLADKQWSEWAMLWDEIAIGFIFAGLIAGFVPQSLWSSIFAQEAFGMPIALIWGAIIGATIGVITFVCSVGNVPFATVLWVGGLPFGGVFSYIYADLVVPPIVDAYREYYGDKFGFILAGLMFICAIVAGIITHIIFISLGLIPDPSSISIATNKIELDYKAYLNIFFTGVFLLLFYLHKQSSQTKSHSQ